MISYFIGLNIFLAIFSRSNRSFLLLIEKTYDMKDELN
jgi:hypothetical protein